MYMPKKKYITFSESINQALDFALKKDKKLFCYGLGINDPKGIFGTTIGLSKKYGKKRVFDIPCSENALTGISIGAALNGYRSVAIHQRLDFFLLAMDQLVNAASKWHYLYGSKKSIAITIRLIIGRGWGQGPTHSQSLQAWFNHIPGLKVVMPTFADDARSLLIESILDPNPVIFLEHRWLHNNRSFKTSKNRKVSIGKARICSKGNDITLITNSYLTLEAIIAAKNLKKYYNINCEIIDLRTIKPLDWKTIFKSIDKTRKVIVLDGGNHIGSIANDIVSKIVIKKFDILEKPPVIMAMPDTPEPTSYALTKDFYISAKDIAQKILNLFEKKPDKNFKTHFKVKHHDQPYETFKGPF